MKKLFLCLLSILMASAANAAIKDYTPTNAIVYEVENENVGPNNFLQRQFNDVQQYNTLRLNVFGETGASIVTADIDWLDESGQTVTSEVLTEGIQISNFKSNRFLVRIWNHAGTSNTINAQVIVYNAHTIAGIDGSTVLSVDDNGGSLTVDNPALSVTGSGDESSALRVTLASDSTGLISVDDNNGSLTVDNSILSVTGGGLELGALRVTIANNSTGVLSIDDNGSSLTVDGTVTVANTTLAVTGGGVELGALRVTLANNSTGLVSVDGGDAGLVVVTSNFLVTASPSTYAAGAVVGSAMSITGSTTNAGRNYILDGGYLYVKNDQNTGVNYSLLIYRSPPSAQIDRTALSLPNIDIGKLAVITASDTVTNAGGATRVFHFKPKEPVEFSGVQNLTAVLLSQTDGAKFTNTTDVVLSLVFHKR